MTHDLARCFLSQYVLLVPGQFTRAEFLAWAATRGLKRETPAEVVDAAFDASLTEREIVAIDADPIRYRRAA